MDPGTISGAGNQLPSPPYNPDTWVLTSVLGASPSPAQILDSVQFIAPTLQNGQSIEDNLSVQTQSFTPGGAADSNAATLSTLKIDIITPPGITGGAGLENDADAPANPFASLLITDADFNNTATDIATITVSNASGMPTDADGILTGIGLTKIGVGTYSLSDATTPFLLRNELNNLTFTPVVGTTTITTSFAIAVTDVKAKLTSTAMISMITPAQPSFTGHTINTHITSPVVLTPADNPLTITKNGSIITSSTPADPFGGSTAITGDATMTWNITNNGSVEVLGSSESEAIDLAGSGTITNSGLLQGANPGFGDIISITIGGYGVINNTGTIDGEIVLNAGGSVTNGPNGYIGGTKAAGIYTPPGSPSVTVVNNGTIGAYGGIDLEGGGTVINKGDIFGAREVFIDGGNGIVENYGTTGVIFSVNVGHALFVDEPGSVNNAVSSQSASSTLELAKGTGTISGIGGNFNGFDTMNVDNGAKWTLTGTNTIGKVLDDGTTIINGAFHVTTAVDPASNGIFQLTDKSSLEIASATGSGTKISFMGSGDNLLIDNASLFGSNVGATNYAGSLLEAFTKGDVIDIKAFAVAGITTSYKPATGLLQLSNGSGQLATLDFQNSSLGAGSFKTVSDGGRGVLITHS